MLSTAPTELAWYKFPFRAVSLPKFRCPLCRAARGAPRCRAVDHPATAAAHGAPHRHAVDLPTAAVRGALRHRRRPWSTPPPCRGATRRRRPWSNPSAHWCSCYSDLIILCLAFLGRLLAIASLITLAYLFIPLHTVHLGVLFNLRHNLVQNKS